MQNWSELFEKMERLKAEYSECNNYSNVIEDYEITEATLEDVFLKVARADTEENGERSLKARFLCFR